MMLTFWRTFKKIHVTDNYSIILAGNKYWGKKLAFYNAGQNIWSRVEKSSKIGQHYKSLISTFACFLTVIAKV